MRLRDVVLLDGLGAATAAMGPPPPPPAGTTSAKWTYTGTVPTMKRVDMSKEPACAVAHTTPSCRRRS